jgi:hypothetical protein
MTTSQPFPIRIGRITFKDRKGPRTDLLRKKAIRTFHSMQSIQSINSYGKTGKA